MNNNNNNYTQLGDGSYPTLPSAPPPPPPPPMHQNAVVYPVDPHSQPPMGQPLVQPAPVYMHPGARPEDNIKCCFCIDGLMGMKVLAILTLIQGILTLLGKEPVLAISTLMITISMFMFVIKDTKGTRMLLLWALSLSFVQDIVIIVVAAIQLSQPGNHDLDVWILQRLIVIGAVAALITIHYMMVAKILVMCAPRNAPVR